MDLAVACLGVGLPCASGGRGAHQDQGVFPGASWNDAHENRKVLQFWDWMRWKICQCSEYKC